MKNFIFIIPLLFFSCNSGETSHVSGDIIVKSTFKEENTAVHVTNVLQGNFNLEILSNGKAYAINNADIRFPINVKIQSIRVRNGESVRRGQVLAILDGAELKSKLARSKEAVDKAEKAYLKAWYMSPDRFYPKYLLAKLYDETGQKQKAIATAKELLAKKAKIESAAIKEIIIEMRQLVRIQ